MAHQPLYQKSYTTLHGVSIVQVTASYMNVALIMFEADIRFFKWYDQTVSNEYINVLMWTVLNNFFKS